MICRKTFVLGMLACFVFLSTVGSGYATDLRPNALMGSTYTIFLFNTDIGSTNISFENDLLFSVAAHKGVGMYLPIGGIFAAFYWAPNYKFERDLLLIFNGVALADFIVGWGLTFPNYQPAGLFLFFGHAEET
jgi:hypothetical protein